MYLMKRRRVAPAAETAATPHAGCGTVVLAFLADQGLTATPSNYELAFLHRFERDSAVARATDALLISGERITQHDADRIMLAHVRHRAHDARHRHDAGTQEAMRQQTLQLADLAADAAATTGAFGRDIGDRLDALIDNGVREVAESMLDRSLHTEQRLRVAAQQIEQLRQDVEAARSDALRDALTGLLNRRGAEVELARVLDAQPPVTVAMCDVDHFKVINDRYGHPVGDRVLKAIAAELAERCRPFTVARWGGEEFAVILSGIDIAGARTVVDRARDAVARKSYRLRDTDEPLGMVTLSAGIAACARGRIEEAIKAADDALYEAKSAGRNRVVQR